MGSSRLCRPLTLLEICGRWRGGGQKTSPPSAVIDGLKIAEWLSSE